MENKITITATSKGAEIILEYNGRTYSQKCIPTNTGARYEGDSFHDATELPDEIVEAVTGFVAYNLMNAFYKVNSIKNTKWKIF